MNTSKITTVKGRAIPLRGENIDTDQLVPGRYLKEITFENMGNYLFYDARFEADGEPKAHPLNEPNYQGANIMIVDRNFGCGSSREHAPQALKRYGINALIGESFAEIFAGNCKAIGIVLVKVSRAEIEKLWQYVEKNPKTIFTIDLEQKIIAYDEKKLNLEIAQDWRQAFLTGHWDVLNLLKANQNLIAAKAEELKQVTFFGG